MKYDKHYDSTNIKYIGHFISANVNGLNSILNKKKKKRTFSLANKVKFKPKCSYEKEKGKLKD